MFSFYTATKSQTSQSWGSLIYGSDEQIVNNKLNDEELLLLFHKVQLSKLTQKEKEHIYITIDALIRDFNAKKAYA